MGNKYKKRREQEEEESEDELDEMEEEEDEEDEGEEGEPGSGKKAPRRTIYNVDEMHSKLEDIGWSMEVAWDEALALTTAQPTVVENVEDDLARELAFYNQALASAQEAIGKFEEAGVPWLRPLDYYAEMVKSDEHMAKVKQQLMFEQQQIEAAEERRKQREAKMFGKQVQQARLKEKNADKKRQIDGISKLRKQREKSGFAGELDVDEHLADLEGKRPINLKQLGQRGPKNSQAPNKKRQAKDAKFGFGGRKSLKKQNDAYSAADMDGYKPGRKDSFGGKGGRGAPKGGPGGPKGGVQKKKGAKPQRPGKQRRQSMKGGKGKR